MRVGIAGAGWAGLAAAVAATQAGHHVTVFEASRTLGGRARALRCDLPNGQYTTIDNGQHILIGAYSATLHLMRRVGVNPDEALLRLPLALVFPDGSGLELPRWPAPLDVIGGILRARGWSLSDKTSLLRLATAWRLNGFRCAADVTVTSLCTRLKPRVMRDLVTPLCVSALNTPVDRASGQVFLRVLHDSVFGAPGASNLLLPRVDLSTLFPDAAASWLVQRGAQVRLGTRLQRLASDGARWRINDDVFDRVILATGASDAVRALTSCLPSAADAVARQVEQWSAVAGALRHEAIATVYAWGKGVTLPRPMLALECSADPSRAGPAQFVFDRGQLGGPSGLLAFMVSASATEREALQQQVLAQADQQLGCALECVQTVIEKRATFACTPGLRRPSMAIAPGLLACADYVHGPYPATLEGAVRAGTAVIQSSGFVS